MLGLPLHRLTWLAYALWEERKYTRFEIQRHGDAPPREILAPVKPLKDVQRTLATKLLEWYDPPVGVHGFVRARSAVSNARTHQRQEWVLRVDIEDFFPSINFGRVYGLFKAYPFEYPHEVASLLAQICCFKNRLPQGAPTSPMISNLICRGLDKSLASLARAEHCYYSRYADDLCFSTRRYEFPGSLAVADAQGVAQPGAAIREVVIQNGFAIHPTKTRLVRRTQRQRVTGLVVNEGVNVDRRYVWSLRNVLHIWHRYGPDDAADAFYRANPRLNWPPKKADPKFAQVIRGRVQHVGSVKGWNSPVYRRLAASLQKVDGTFAPSTIRELHSKVSVRIYTEGVTDVLHLKAAKRYFEALGEFNNLNFEFPQPAGAGGSSELWTICKGLSVSRPALMCVCVFDRDETKMLARAVGGGEMKEHGPNVAAIAIKPPEWREEADPLSIELLYTDSDLQRKDPAGGRLYLRSEFDDNGRHESEPVYILTPKAKELIREEVLAAHDGSPVGLAKTAFAKYVHDTAPGFADVDFSGFRPTFTLIEEAVARFSRVS